MRSLMRRLMQLADLQVPRGLQTVLGLPRRLFAHRVTSALQVRLAGAALCTAGLAFVGFGTLGAPLAKGGIALTAATCAADTECVHATQVPTSGDNVGCTDISALLGQALDPTDSYWHFVIPGSQGFAFNGTNFTATFSGGATETTTFVQGSSGNFMGVVVEADGGATLQNAVVLESGITGESTEAEGTGAENSAAGGDFQLSSTCATPATSTTSSGTTTSNTTTAPGSTTLTTTKTTTAPGSTVTTTSTTTSTTSTTSTTASTQKTTVTDSTTVTVPTTTTVTGGTPGSSSSSSSVTTSSPTTTSAGVLPATTTTPGTGADIEFGVGLVLLVTGGGFVAFATRMTRRN